MITDLHIILIINPHKIFKNYNIDLERSYCIKMSQKVKSWSLETGSSLSFV